ncbi:MAG TPA: hypothetical protein VFG11_06090 [Acidobacteriota bacterium]|nr:hypothetical protein [Acidobacteriota bacterium]
MKLLIHATLIVCLLSSGLATVSLFAPACCINNKACPMRHEVPSNSCHHSNPADTLRVKNCQPVQSMNVLLQPGILAPETVWMISGPAATRRVAASQFLDFAPLSVPHQPPRVSA